jgi:hypothetical protein
VEELPEGNFVSRSFFIPHVGNLGAVHLCPGAILFQGHFYSTCWFLGVVH